MELRVIIKPPKRHGKQSGKCGYAVTHLSPRLRFQQDYMTLQRVMALKACETVSHLFLGDTYCRLKFAAADQMV